MTCSFTTTSTTTERRSIMSQLHQQLVLIMVISSLLTSESEAWFHKPRCPPRDPKCNRMGAREVSKRHIVSLREFARLTVPPPPLPAHMMSVGNRIVHHNNNHHTARRLRQFANRSRHDIRYRSRLQRYRDRYSRS